MQARSALRSRLILVTLAGALIAAACAESTADTEIDEPTADGTTSARDTFVSRYGQAWPDTDFSQHAIEPSELLSGGPGKDGIPAIDEPQFVSIEEAAEFLVDDEPVIIVSSGDEARAYPIQILMWHEIVNDEIGSVPVTVTFCPLCNSAITFARELDGTIFDFGVSGLLRNSDLVMYDRQTESWWQQFTGEAIVGELTGAALEILPSATVSFRDFSASYPDGLVLSRDTGFSRDYGRNPYTGYDSTENPFLFDGDTDGRLSAVERVVAVELNGETVAYPFSTMAEEIVVRDTIGGTDIVVFFQEGTTSALDGPSIAESRDVGATGVFLPEANGQELTFRADGDRIVDDETGSAWNILGIATDGPLEGTRLDRVVHGDHFWFAWAAFKPDTRVWTP